MIHMITCPVFTYEYEVLNECVKIGRAEVYILISHISKVGISKWQNSLCNFEKSYVICEYWGVVQNGQSE